ncbi:hypothetical protein JTE90_028485 [Oedothorax gibbosus]|uniref:Uncharacterized protein n=1 Tax=Oedothorax gibbosus TaxID=931172 RepID=A0AAV6VW10_9ARAC|nr:hypothetical protein JTE90_028485 [Oedothorax gibbosus]
MHKPDGKPRSLDQSFKCLETAVSDATYALIRNINTEWQKVERYKSTIIAKEDEIVNGKERMQHLNESLYHIEKHLGGTSRRIESLKKSNEELNKNITRLRREENKVSKECSEEKQKLDEKLRFYENKWQERYQTRYVNMPFVQEHETAKKSLEDAKKKLQNLKSELRECQSEIFKGKCERGKRNAEESGFYPLESFILRLASAGVDLAKLETEEVDKSKYISRLQCDINAIQRRLLNQARKLEPVINTRTASTNQKIEHYYQSIENSSNPDATYKRNGTMKHSNNERPFVPNSELGRYKSKHVQPELCQLPTAEKSKSKQDNEGVKQSIQDKVRNRIEKLKLYTPKLYSSPPIQNSNNFKQPQEVNNERKTLNKPLISTDSHNPTAENIPTKSSFFKNKSEVIYNVRDVNTETATVRNEIPQNQVYKKAAMSEQRCRTPENKQEEHAKLQKYATPYTPRLITEGTSYQQKPMRESFNIMQVETTESMNKITPDNSNLKENQHHLYSKNIETQNNLNEKLMTTYSNGHSEYFTDKDQNLQFFNKETLIETARKKIDTQNYREINHKQNSYMQQSKMVDEQQMTTNQVQMNQVVEKTVSKDIQGDQVTLDNLNQNENYINDPFAHSQNMMMAPESNTFHNPAILKETFPNVRKATEGYMESAQKENLLQQVQKASVVNFIRQSEINANMNLNHHFLEQKVTSIRENKEVTNSSKYFQEVQNMNNDNHYEIFQPETVHAQREYKRQKVEYGTDGRPSIVQEKLEKINISKDNSHQGEVPIRSVHGENETNITDMNIVEQESLKTIEKPVTIPTKEQSCGSTNQTYQFQKNTTTKEICHIEELEHKLPSDKSETKVNNENVFPHERKEKSPNVKPLSQQINDETESNFQQEQTENYETQTSEIPMDVDQSQNNLSKSANDSTQYLTAKSNEAFSDKMQASYTSARTPSDPTNIMGNAISPFDFEKHMNTLKELKESPHFTYQSRFMYKNNPEQVDDNAKPTLMKSEVFNAPSFFTEEKNETINQPLVQEKTKEDKADFLSFAYDDYLSDSPASPDTGGKEKPMFAFGEDSPKSDVKSPGFFPLFAADTQESKKDTKSGFAFNFGKAKSPEQSSGFNFLF